MSEISAFQISFTRFGGIFKLEKFQYKTHPDFETKIGRKKCVLYTGIYARHYMVNISNVKAVCQIFIAWRVLDPLCSQSNIMVKDKCLDLK